MDRLYVVSSPNPKGSTDSRLHMVNKHGLSREIPASVKREIRQRSKFGCVICRAGVYDYEHIDPEYKDAVKHDADDMCCLCSACHVKVTRRHFSKDYVRKKYREIDGASIESVPPPFDFLDFHDGKAELLVGGISYDPGVTSVVRYHGQDIISVSPTVGSETAGINAVFRDDTGKRTLSIEDNQWQGAVEAWDTEVVGQRIKVRKKKGAFALVLRLEPPGRIVIERLNMRIHDAHILVSEETYAIGRYVDTKNIYWFHARMHHMSAPLKGASAIELLTYGEAAWRDKLWVGRGKRMATADNLIVMQTGFGVGHKPLGIIVGANCLKFRTGSFAAGGPRPLAKMRKMVFNQPDLVAAYIGTRNL
jgi:hypothetical protein